MSSNNSFKKYNMTKIIRTAIKWQSWVGMAYYFMWDSQIRTQSFCENYVKTCRMWSSWTPYVPGGGGCKKKNKQRYCETVGELSWYTKQESCFQVSLTPKLIFVISVFDNFESTH